MYDECENDLHDHCPDCGACYDCDEECDLGYEHPWEDEYEQD